MGFLKWDMAIALLVLMSTAISAQEENCNFLDEHLESAINSFIEKLPRERPETIEKSAEPPEGLNLIEFKFVNLNSLRPFGPFLTFCRNGSKFVQFDLVNRRPLFLIGSFSGNDSKTHRMESRALLVRLTAQFEVEGSKEDLKLHPTVNLPVSMVGVTMVLKSVDADTNEELGTFIGLGRPSFLRSLWHGMLFSELEKLFAEILPKK
uniref:Putative secreted protein n=1 Tax=Amblyomma cajennense TaxID=34607 RepID=A0A023FD12_AMBCJ